MLRGLKRSCPEGRVHVAPSLAHRVRELYIGYVRGDCKGHVFTFGLGEIPGYLISVLKIGVMLALCALSMMRSGAFSPI
eukprot:11198212-Lingulodinium_polyedra.AAC.1